MLRVSSGCRGREGSERRVDSLGVMMMRRSVCWFLALHSDLNGLHVRMKYTWNRLIISLGCRYISPFTGALHAHGDQIETSNGGVSVQYYTARCSIARKR